MDASKPKERLAEISRALRAGESVPVLTVRSFLGWFWGTVRRGHWIVGYIRKSLAEAGLRTEPDFESAYLDAPMWFELAEKENVAGTQKETTETPETITVSDHKEVRVVNAVFADPTFRV